MESSWPRDQTHIPCIGKWILIHCTTREVKDLSDLYTPPDFCIFCPGCAFGSFSPDVFLHFQGPGTNAQPPLGSTALSQSASGSYSLQSACSLLPTHRTGRSVCPPSLRSHLWGPSITQVGTRYRGTELSVYRIKD